MSSESQITESALPEFFESFAKILDKPDIKTFEWSGNGKYVAVHLQLYQEALTSQREELSVFGEQKELLSLSTFLYSKGFKKISRGELVKRQKTGHSHPQAPEDIPYVPELRRTVRDLYQYINLDLHEPAHLSPRPLHILPS